MFCRISTNDSKELVREAGERKTRFRALHASVEPRLSPRSDVHCLVDRRMTCPVAFLRTGKESKSCGQSQCCKEGPYQDRPPLCPFRLLPLLIYSGSTIAFLNFQGPNPKI